MLIPKYNIIIGDFGLGPITNPQSPYNSLFIYFYIKIIKIY